MTVQFTFCSTFQKKTLTHAYLGKNNQEEKMKECLGLGKSYDPDTIPIFGFGIVHDWSLPRKGSINVP